MEEGTTFDPSAVSPNATQRVEGPRSTRHHWWAQLVRLAALARDRSPLTLRGVGIVASASLCLQWFGYRDLDGVWYVAGIGLLGLCAVALLCMGLGFILTLIFVRRAARTAAPLRASTETGASCSTGFSLPSLRFVPLVEVQLGLVPAGQAEVSTQLEGKTLTEQLRFHDHGDVREVLRRIEVRDVLGLTSLALRAPSRVEIDVLPHLGAFRTLPLLYSLSGGDDIPHPLGVDQGDRLELKRYAPGDPARFIHWKVYARTGKLVVRMPERALSRAYRVAAYLCAGEDDGATAAAARAALELGAFGADFRFGADGTRGVAREVGDALTALRRSAAARALGGQGLTAFLAQAEREGPCSLVVFVPPTAQPPLLRMRELLRGHARPVRVVIGVDGIVRTGAGSWATRLFLAGRKRTAIDAAQLHASVLAYRALGCDVVVLDRSNGRMLSDVHFAAASARAEQAA
jgi:hypothetical protein